MATDYFISDLHLGHKRILEFSNRPFATIEEHDEALIENWNREVKKGDNVYFLGDLCYKSKNGALEYCKRLNGNIFFIEGNHDASARQIRTAFVWYKNLHRIKIKSQDIVLCHYSMRVWDKSHYGAYHLYGHSHNSLPDDPHALSMDVGVDATACRLAGIQTGVFTPPGVTRPQDYRPITFDEVVEFMSVKVWVPIDHHGRTREMS